MLLNVIWLVFGGLWMALGYVLAGALLAITIIGIPFAIASFRMANFALWPFGRRLVDAPSSGALAGIGNVLWLILAGWWLALGHIVTGDTVEALAGEMGVDAANLQASIDAYNAAVQPLLQVYAGHNNGWFILPLIAGGTQFLANWIMQKGQPAPDPNNPAASTNKMMMWLFPLMSLWFCLSYNAAFAIYWILTSVSMVLVNLVLNKKFPRAAVAQEGGKR